VFQALQELEELEMGVEGVAVETKDEAARKLLREIEELHTHVAAVCDVTILTGRYRAHLTLPRPAKGLHR
jgi:hypothetical protein